MIQITSGNKKVVCGGEHCHRHYLCSRDEQVLLISPAAVASATTTLLSNTNRKSVKFLLKRGECIVLMGSAYWPGTAASYHSILKVTNPPVNKEIIGMSRYFAAATILLPWSEQHTTDLSCHCCLKVKDMSRCCHAKEYLASMSCC
ncbi:hypothetical protein O3P69_020220 [Scylla paramamosain]|uniref:Uncharacterized protein n=1 Tax=Scylla paramamosain TaxID=85552 RepID=A0AAW0TL85_SCYPA